MADDELAGASPPAPPPDGPLEPADHAAPRRRGLRAVFIVLAAVVALAVVAGVGLAIGRVTAPGPDIVVAPGPIVEESPVAEPLPVGVASATPTPSSSPTPSATAPTAPLRPGIAVTPAAPGDLPVLMTADPDLPDTPGTASGYRLVSSGISPAQVAGVLGSVFGVAGSPVVDGSSWVVGSDTGPRLVVQDDPLVTWTYADPAAKAQPAAGPPMEADRAIELATALLGSIGVDTRSVDWQVDRYSGMTAVTAWQLVAGSRTRLSWQVGFDPSGAVVQASGFSAGLEEVPGYPVVGAATAVRRSGEPGWSAVGPRPIPGPTTDAAPSASPSPSATTTPDRPSVTVPVREVTVTGAALGLAQYWQPDGSILFLPAYALTAEDGTRWTLLAVDEPYVQFVDQPYPTSVPVAS